MEILKSGICALVMAGSAFSLQAASVEGVTLYPGLTLETVPNVTGMGVAKDMDIDPITGHVFIAQATGGGTGNILQVNPQGGTVGNIPFPSNGLAFAPDGTLYFGVASALLATWRRDTDVFRIFASIPGIRDVQVTREGELYAASSGPTQVSNPDAVLRIDRRDGHFEEVLTRSQVEAALGSLSNLFYFARTSDGTLVTSYHIGENVRLTPGCSGGNLAPCLSHFNTRDGRIGELNNAALAVTPDDLVFHFDVTGQLFALWPDGRIKLVAFGSGIRGSGGSADTAMVTDGKNVYFANDTRQLFRLKVSNGAELKAHLEPALGTVTLRGTVKHPSTGAPIAGATVTLNATTSVTTGSDGSYRFADLATGLYEVRVVAAGFPNVYKQLDLTAAGQSVFDPELVLGLPTFLAAGLKVEILATKERDNIIGNVDLNLDKEGHLYTINNADTARGGNITKIFLHPQSRDYQSSQLVAQGGNMVNAWFVVIDDALNVYTSTGNSGVLKLPPQGPGQALQLSVVDSTTVRDQTGANRFMSRIRDSDGGVFLKNGDLVMGSGTSGNSAEAIPCFPNGTRNTLIRRAAPIGDSPCAADGSGGKESVYSTGTPTGGGSSLISNPDIIKIDNQERIYITNREIAGTPYSNATRIKADCTAASLCSAELLWPGNGAGKPADSNGNPVTVGVFSTSLADQDGNAFVRGFDFYNNASIRLIAPDGQSMLPVAGGLLSDYGGMLLEPGGKMLYVANKNNVLRIRSLDDRTIAANLLAPPAGAGASGKMVTERQYAARFGKVDDDGEGYNEALIPWHLLKPADPPSGTTPPASSGGGGGGLSLGWLALLGMLRRRR